MADQILNNAQTILNRYSDLKDQNLNQLVKNIPLPNKKIYCEAFRLENKNIKIAMELLSEFSHSALKNIKWQNQDLFNVANKFDKNTKNSAIFILKKYSPSWTDILTENLKKNMEQYIGKFSNANHGLNLLDKIYIPNLHERQVTEGFAQCLGSGDKTKKYNKVLCFLKALRVSEDFLEKEEFLKKTAWKNCNLAVEAEVETKDNKRMDILISWTSPGKYHGVVIEAKFDHKVTPGQLSAYKKYCSKEKGIEKPELILLTNEGNQYSKHKDWRPLSWLSLLTRLEKALDGQECDDYIFTCFRAMAWNKIRGV